MLHMRTITLRKLHPDLEKRLERTARERGWSLSKTVIRLLEERLRQPAAPRTRRPDAIDALAGTWTAEEAREFDRALAGQRRIDADLWD